MLLHRTKAVPTRDLQKRGQGMRKGLLCTRAKTSPAFCGGLYKGPESWDSFCSPTEKPSSSMMLCGTWCTSAAAGNSTSGEAEKIPLQQTRLVITSWLKASNINPEELCFVLLVCFLYNNIMKQSCKIENLINITFAADGENLPAWTSNPVNSSDSISSARCSICPFDSALRYASGKPQPAKQLPVDPTSTQEHRQARL